MPSASPGQMELKASFHQHLGPRFEFAGLAVQFHHNQEPGIHFRVPVPEAYREAILRGLEEGMARRFPEFLATGSLFPLSLSR